MDHLIPISFLILLTMAVPFIIVGTTAFIKIAVVMFILRNALGLQQAPPNMALYGVTLVLVAFIQAPVFVASYDAIMAAGFDPKTPTSWWPTLQAGIVPIADFMNANTTLLEKQFFLDAGEKLYAGSRLELTEESVLVLLPSFLNAELKAALQIGVLLFLPFLAIDIVITNILTALGMNMVTPMVISLPFKVLLFVAVDGWSRLTHSLIMSYVPLPAQ